MNPPERTEARHLGIVQVHITLFEKGSARAREIAFVCMIARLCHRTERQGKSFASHRNAGQTFAKAYETNNRIVLQVPVVLP
jgi:hypothetical protein